MTDTPAWAYEAVRLVPPDPDWPRHGEQLRSDLADRLAPWSVADVEHVGSTSVPGLVAKPIPDLQAAVADLECAPQVAATLAAHGWHYVPPELGGRPWRRFFVLAPDDHRVAHLYLMTRPSRVWSSRFASGMHSAAMQNSHVVTVTSSGTWWCRTPTTGRRTRTERPTSSGLC